MNGLTNEGEVELRRKRGSQRSARKPTEPQSNRADRKEEDDGLGDEDLEGPDEGRLQNLCEGLLEPFLVRDKALIARLLPQLLRPLSQKDDGVSFRKSESSGDAGRPRDGEQDVLQQGD